MIRLGQEQSALTSAKRRWIEVECCCCCVSKLAGMTQTWEATGNSNVEFEGARRMGEAEVIR